MEEFAGALRAILASVGGALAAQGYINANDAQAIAGALATLLVAAWSVYQKRKAKYNKVGEPPIVAFIALGLSLSICLSACAGTSPNDCTANVAATEIAITEGYRTATNLLTSGLISKSVAKQALNALDAANAAADSAAPLCKMHDPRASDYLIQAAAALAKFTTLTGVKQ